VEKAMAMHPPLPAEKNSLSLVYFPLSCPTYNTHEVAQRQTALMSFRNQFTEAGNFLKQHHRTFSSSFRFSVANTSSYFSRVPKGTRELRSLQIERDGAPCANRLLYTHPLLLITRTIPTAH